MPSESRPVSFYPPHGNPKGTDRIFVSQDMGGGTWASKRLDLDQLGSTLGYILLRDEKPPGTSGGTSVVGWQTRDLNTESFDTGNDCTLSGNQFTLQPGTYEIFARAPAAASGATVIRLYNVTQGWVERVGSNHWHDVNDGGVLDAVLHNRFTITTATTFRIEHYFGSGAANGLGYFVSGTTNEVYTEVVLRKVSRTGVASNTGGVDYLGEFTVAGGNLDIFGVLDANAYKSFFVDIRDLVFGTASTSPRLRFAVDTTILSAANYSFAFHYGATGGVSSGGGNNGLDHIQCGAGGNAVSTSFPHRMTMSIPQRSSGAYSLITSSWMGSLSNGDNFVSQVGGRWNQADQWDGFRVYPSSGAFTSGTARVWGYRG